LNLPKIPSLRIRWWHWILHPVRSWHVSRFFKECKEIEEDDDGIVVISSTGWDDNWYFYHRPAKRK